MQLVQEHLLRKLYHHMGRVHPSQCHKPLLLPTKPNRVHGYQHDILPILIIEKLKFKGKSVFFFKEDP